jgi:glutathione reductase (NADPH)
LQIDLQSSGRAPDLDALNLAAAGVTVEHGRIVLNEFLQSGGDKRGIFRFAKLS